MHANPPHFTIMFPLGFGRITIRLCLRELPLLKDIYEYIATSFHQKTFFMENTFAPVNEQNESVVMPEATEETTNENAPAFEVEQNEEGTEENPDEIDAEDLSGEIEEDDAATEEPAEE